MKPIFFLLVSFLLYSCGHDKSENTARSAKLPLTGTWKLLTATLIQEGDTTITDYTNKRSFIKIINNTHFAFLQHDLKKDSTANFVAGGGPYTLSDSVYTERLEYCSAREWEGNDFAFTINIRNDTLTQYGIEKVEKAGINRMNIEKYVRLHEDR